ncbi:MAG: glycosyltransferase family 61 protein [Acetobacter sp.]|nr:glycosyltransferase family 61 protein [Acetobacter sp.]
MTYLKNCIVLPNAAILTEGGSIIKESCFPYSDRKRILKMFNPWIVENEGEIFINTDGLEIVDKETLYVREHGEMGFFHWMHSVFPRVDVIESQLLPSDCQVLIQRKAKFQIESIALFDFQGRTIVTPPLDRPQFYKELIFPSALVEDGDFWLRPPSVKQFYSALPISVREQPRRIYITRQDAGFRRLTNESAVLLSESKSDLIDFSQNSADMSDHKPSFR